MHLLPSLTVTRNRLDNFQGKILRFSQSNFFPTDSYRAGTSLTSPPLVGGGAAREQDTLLHKGKIMNVNSENDYITNLGFLYGPVRNPYRRVLLVVFRTNRTWFEGFAVEITVVWLPPWLLLPLLGWD